MKGLHNFFEGLLESDVKNLLTVNFRLYETCTAPLVCTPFVIIRGTC